MTQPVTIAVDVMGGDHGPGVIGPACAQILAADPGVILTLVGTSAALAHDGVPAPNGRVRHHAVAAVIPTDMKPSQAVRQGTDTTIGGAVQLVREGAAQAVVSAGNTGALMAIGRLRLGVLDGVDRPAIVAILPTIEGMVVALDLGASTDADAESLYQFAAMGGAFAQSELALAEPRIGLINVGAEQVKGNRLVQEADQLLRTRPLTGRYVGFVEGTALGVGGCDVAVTDGFTGNVALKTLEATARVFMHGLKRSIMQRLWAKLGAVMMRGAFEDFRAFADPRSYNGAMMIGLKGVVIKSHGSADAGAFANALDRAARLVRDGVNRRVSDTLAQVASADAPGDEMTGDALAAVD